MAEETVGDEEGKSQKPKKGGIKMLVIIIGATLVLGGGGFTSFMLLKDRGAKHEAKSESEEKGEKEETASMLMPLEPFVVNLAAPGRYLKITLNFELKDQADKTLIENRMPVLRDAVITLLSSKSSEAVSGPEGKFQLKDEILFRANQSLGKEIFKNLYFTEFVMQ